MRAIRDWLPPGKRAGVCFTIDDVHPGRSKNHYDGGGDLGDGALGLVADLLERHRQLRITLFTTADWREISPMPSRCLARIPLLRDRMYLSRILPAGTYRIDRHPQFVAYLRSLPRVEIGLHGLHHVHKGPLLHVEFQDEPVVEHLRKLRRMIEIFEASGLQYTRGMCPPGWNAPPALLRAMAELAFEFVASARDINTPVAADATTAMSGLRGVPLIYPTRLAGGLIHISTNFQATSRWDRARDIIELGGLVAVKGHIVKNALGFIALDGIDRVYCNLLDLLFERLQREYGDSLWWTTPGEIASRLREQHTGNAS
jgi:hypothetical protein